MKAHYIVLILLMTSLAINPLLAENNISCIATGGLLMAAMLSATQTYHEYKKTNAAFSVAKGKELYRRMINRNDMSINKYFKNSEQLMQTYGPLCLWAAATLILTVMSIKLLTRCFEQ